jgi:uncharacterized protein (DUF2267 family)
MPDDAPPVLATALSDATRWIDTVAREAGTDRATALLVLGAGLHALRDRLGVVAAADLSRDLPVVVRGLFFDGWTPAATPVRDRTLRDWLVTLEGHLIAADADAVPPETAARAVFATLRAHLGEARCRRLARVLPGDLAPLLRAA